MDDGCSIAQVTSECLTARRRTTRTARLAAALARDISARALAKLPWEGNCVASDAPRSLDSSLLLCRLPPPQLLRCGPLTPGLDPPRATSGFTMDDERTARAVELFRAHPELRTPAAVARARENRRCVVLGPCLQRFRSRLLGRLSANINASGLWFLLAKLTASQAPLSPHRRRFPRCPCDPRALRLGERETRCRPGTLWRGTAIRRVRQMSHLVCPNTARSTELQRRYACQFRWPLARPCSSGP